MADANECAFPEKPPCGNCTLCQLREARAANRAQYVAGLLRAAEVFDGYAADANQRLDATPLHQHELRRDHYAAIMRSRTDAAAIRELAEQAKRG